MYVCMHVYIYLHRRKERRGKRETETEKMPICLTHFTDNERIPEVTTPVQSTPLKQTLESIERFSSRNDFNQSYALYASDGIKVTLLLHR